MDRFVLLATTGKNAKNKTLLCCHGATDPPLQFSYIYINIVKESSILDTEIDIKKAQKWALSKVEKDIEQQY